MEGALGWTQAREPSAAAKGGLESESGSEDTEEERNAAARGVERASKRRRRGAGRCEGGARTPGAAGGGRGSAFRSNVVPSLRGTDTGAVVEVSELFRGLEFYVLSGGGRG